MKLLEMLDRGLNEKETQITISKQPIGAVSYTHLDVYKRQDMISPIIREENNPSAMALIASTKYR